MVWVFRMNRKREEDKGRWYLLHGMESEVKIMPFSSISFASIFPYYVLIRLFKAVVTTVLS